jgi:hypothetical protein
LHPNTTYTFNFGQAIADNNEGNMLENFEFVFSTGDYIDSLAIAGSLYSAFDRKMPEDPVVVLLYENLSDSAPYREIPSYVGKSNKKGTFRVNNLKQDTFRVFALKDANGNLKYDMPEEDIAFLDSLLILDPAMFDYLKDTSGRGITDTLAAETPTPAQKNTDSLLSVTDTTGLQPVNPYTLFIDLYLFREDNKPQYLADKIRVQPDMIRLIFNRPLKKDILMLPVNFQSADRWFIREGHVHKDTVDYWITDSLIYRKDTLLISVRYEMTDTVMNYYFRTDTLRLVNAAPSADKRRAKTTIQKEPSGLSMNISVRPRANQHIYQGISMEAANPVGSANPAKITLSYTIDTLSYVQDFKLIKDTVYLRNYNLETTWREDTPYNLFLEPGAFTDIYGLTNDTIQIPFRTQTSEHYGRIIANLSNVWSPLIIQLLTQKEGLVREQYLEKDGSVLFEFLEPATYLLKVIYDTNENRKWDTGRYLEKRQPERVAYYSSPVEVRANWDKEVIWLLAK